MKKRILYAEANYAAMVRRNGYFVDKTEYIAKLENVDNPVFLRPRRFGKSLLCTMLEHYYSVRFKAQFGELFGRTDLEFVGKFSDCFVDVRMVIEFKYFSNTEFRKFKCLADDFELRDEDLEQIEGYVEGLKTEYPEARVTKHVIYCFGNIGCKVFDIA